MISLTKKKKIFFFSFSILNVQGLSKTSLGWKALCFLVSLVGLVKTAHIFWGSFAAWASDLVKTGLKSIGHSDHVKWPVCHGSVAGANSVSRNLGCIGWIVSLGSHSDSLHGEDPPPFPRDEAERKRLTDGPGSSGQSPRWLVLWPWLSDLELSSLLHHPREVCCRVLELVDWKDITLLRRRGPLEQFWDGAGKEQEDSPLNIYANPSYPKSLHHQFSEMCMACLNLHLMESVFPFPATVPLTRSF